MSELPIIVTVTGQIKTCTTNRSNDLYCKYAIVLGPDWSMARGDQEGTTQTSKLSPSNLVTWNHPIDVAFKAAKPFGWPQLVLAIYGKNRLGATMVVGYGVTHLPTTPGNHDLTVPIFVPQSSSLMQSLIGWFTGISPEFINYNFIAGGENREVTKTESQGHVAVTLGVMMKGLDTLDLVYK